MDRKEYMRQWREKNREEIRQKHKEWRDSKEHPNYTKRTRNKKLQMLREHLGGKCVGCGVTTGLQFDHIDRTQKEFNISENRDKSYDVLLEEVNKCQLLCRNCHITKSRVNYDHEELLKGYDLQSITKEGNRITIVYELH